MQIHRLVINEKKCLVGFEIRFHTESDKSTTILIGENGTGKSTMMESILEILMSFDSPTIEKQIDYDYTFEYEFAQKSICITKSGRNYCFNIDGKVIEGRYSAIKRWLKEQRVFPKRIIAYYSGANNKLKPAILKMNAQYRKQYLKTMAGALVDIFDDKTLEIPPSPIRKFNFCDEYLVPIYLCAILDGLDSYEKSYLGEECNCSEIDHVSMVINLDKVERFFGRDRFEDGAPQNLYFTMDYVEHQLTDVLRRGWYSSDNGKGYFELRGIRETGLDSRAILEAFEVLHDLFDAKFETFVKIGDRPVSASDMSEGQRQLIKILGMLGICKREDCLFLLDEPDAHMNPKWKYGIKKVIDECLKDANNAQTIIATHDPLVINGVPKENIRIFTRNASDIQDNRLITKAIEPSEDTIGMGIDGLLQSEYYGLRTSYDPKADRDFKERQELYIKVINNEATPAEKNRLIELTKEIGSFHVSNNTIDFLYDDFLSVYRKSPFYLEDYLSPDEIRERKDTIQEIIESLFRNRQ